MFWETLYEWLLQVPQAVGNFAGWLTQPISAGYIDISPLGLLGVGGFSVLVVIIGIHVVRLFV